MENIPDQFKPVFFTEQIIPLREKFEITTEGTPWDSNFSIDKTFATSEILVTFDNIRFKNDNYCLVKNVDYIKIDGVNYYMEFNDNFTQASEVAAFVKRFMISVGLSLGKNYTFMYDENNPYIVNGYFSFGELTSLQLTYNFSRLLGMSTGIYNGDDTYHSGPIIPFIETYQFLTDFGQDTISLNNKSLRKILTEGNFGYPNSQISITGNTIRTTSKYWNIKLVDDMLVPVKIQSPIIYRLSISEIYPSYHQYPKIPSYLKNLFSSSAKPAYFNRDQLTEISNIAPEWLNKAIELHNKVDYERLQQKLAKKRVKLVKMIQEEKYDTTLLEKSLTTLDKILSEPFSIKLLAKGNELIKNIYNKGYKEIPLNKLMKKLQKENKEYIKKYLLKDMPKSRGARADDVNRTIDKMLNKLYIDPKINSKSKPVIYKGGIYAKHKKGTRLSRVKKFMPNKWSSNQKSSMHYFTKQSKAPVTKPFVSSILEKTTTPVPDNEEAFEKYYLEKSLEEKLYKAALKRNRKYIVDKLIASDVRFEDDIEFISNAVEHLIFSPKINSEDLRIIDTGLAGINQAGLTMDQQIEIIKEGGHNIEEWLIGKISNKYMADLTSEDIESYVEAIKDGVQSNEEKQLALAKKIEEMNDLGIHDQFKIDSTNMTDDDKTLAKLKMTPEYFERVINNFNIASSGISEEDDEKI